MIPTKMTSERASDLLQMFRISLFLKLHGSPFITLQPSNIIRRYKIMDHSSTQERHMTCPSAFFPSLYASLSTTFPSLLRCKPRREFLYIFSFSLDNVKFFPIPIRLHCGSFFLSFPGCACASINYIAVVNYILIITGVEMFTLYCVCLTATAATEVHSAAAGPP